MVKGKVVLVFNLEAMKTYRGSGVIALHVLNHGARWK
jgi:hypothetical protein